MYEPIINKLLDYHRRLKPTVNQLFSLRENLKQQLTVQSFTAQKSRRDVTLLTGEFILRYAKNELLNYRIIDSLPINYSIIQLFNH